jgi:hypothetical protein
VSKREKEKVHVKENKKERRRETNKTWGWLSPE